MLSSEDAYSEIEEIVKKFNSDREIIPSDTYQYDGIEGISPRLIRAAGNHVSACNEPGKGVAMFSRYGIWAGTIRGVLKELLVHMEDKSISATDEKNLIKVINSLSAFCEVQKHLDPLSLG